MIKVIYIEDDPYIREFISNFLQKSREFDFLTATETVEEFLEQANHLKKPDIILLDINLPGMSGLEAIRHLKNLFPKAEIIMFTIHDDSERIFKALCAGASGYLLKSTPVPKIGEGIHQVYRGESAMSPSVARKVVQYFQPERKKRNATDLTPREIQIVQCMVEGLSYKLIADKLMISINTICYHVKNIYRKLQVNSKAEVIAKSLKNEL